MILEPNKSTYNRYSDKFLFFIGLIGVLFFGLCVFFILKKIFSRKIGLIINEKGIIDNSNATSVGLIEWKDITEIETIQIKTPVYGPIGTVSTPRMMIIKTSRPEKYIERSKNIILKKAMEANNRMYGTPLTIISISLKIKFSELEKIISEELKNHKI